MKFFQLSVVSVLISSVSLAAQSPLSVATGISSRSVTLYRADSLRVLDSRVDSNQPLNSWIKLELTGIYEGNICADDSVGFEKTFIGENGSQWSYVLRMKSLTLQSSEFRLEDPACFLVAKPTPFVSNMTLNVNHWRSTDSNRTWVYQIENFDGSVLKVLRVSLDLSGGWTVTLDPG